MHRPQTACSTGSRHGGQARPLERASSAPSLRRPQSGQAAKPPRGQRPASAGTQAYRSKAIELEVRLREQLAETGVQGGDGLYLPPSAALIDGAMSSSAGPRLRLQGGDE